MAVRSYVVTKPSGDDTVDFVLHPERFPEFVFKTMTQEARVLKLDARPDLDEITARRYGEGREQSFEFDVIEMYTPGNEFRINVQDSRTLEWATIEVRDQVYLSIVKD